MTHCLSENSVHKWHKIVVVQCLPFPKKRISQRLHWPTELKPTKKNKSVIKKCYKSRKKIIIFIIFWKLLFIISYFFFYFSFSSSSSSFIFFNIFRSFFFLLLHYAINVPKQKKKKERKKKIIIIFCFFTFALLISPIKKAIIILFCSSDMLQCVIERFNHSTFLKTQRTKRWKKSNKKGKVKKIT